MFPSSTTGGCEARSASLDQLERQIAELAAQIAADMCRWLLLVAEFERRRGHEAWGFHCCATWLSWRCSISPRSAREHLRVARALPELPLVREAFSRGELSYSKVRALTRVVGPGSEEAELLELARHATAAQLERVIGACRRSIDFDLARGAHERRTLSYTWEDDGSLSFRGRLSAEDGALFLRALEAGRERGSAEPFDGPVRTNADALVTMSETLLAKRAAARSGGERYQIVVHADAEALAGNRSERPCELEDGSAVSPETARRLSCDASVVRMAEDVNGPLSVGRKTRSIPPAIRRALRSRDRGCRFPGCTHHRWVDAHHIRHWAQGGETSLGNLVQLCRRHHRLLHEGGFSVEQRPNGTLLFRRPGGKPVRPVPTLRAPMRRRSIGAPQPMPFPLSRGEPMDLDLTVWGVMARLGPRDSASGALEDP